MASEIKVDTISEKTSANGVTIDGVSLKDSKIATANSVDSDAYVDGSIDTAHIDALQVTGAKLNTDVISAQTELAAEPADADEFMVSDGGVLKRIDYSLIKAVGNTPYFFAYRGTSEQSIDDATQTIIEYNAELYDSGSCFDTGTYKFTPNVAGKYWIQATVRMADSTNADNINLEIWKSGATVSRTNMSNRNYTSVWNSVIVDMDGSSDYIQAKIYQDTGGSANIGMNSDSTYQTFLQGFFIGS